MTKLVVNRLRKRLLLLFFAALVVVPLWPQEPQNDEDEDEELPLVIVANSSEIRTGDDDTLLDIVVNTITSLGVYRAIKSGVNYKEGSMPTATTQSGALPLYILTSCRIPDQGVTHYRMTLWGVKEGNIAGSNEIDYYDINEVESAAQLLVAQLFFLVPPPVRRLAAQNLTWKDCYLYVGSVAAFTFRQYRGDENNDDYDGTSFFGGVSLDWQFFLYKPWDLGLSLGVELGFTRNQFLLGNGGNTEFEGKTFAMELPIMLKVSWYPNIMMLAAQFGVYPIVSLPGQSPVDGSPQLGLLFGLEQGIRLLDRGILSLFIRIAGDLGLYKYDSTDKYPNADKYRINRFSFNFGLAFKMSVVERPQKRIVAFNGGW